MTNDQANTGGSKGGPSHSHMWLIGVLGMAAGLVLMIYVPALEAVSGIILLVAGFHLVGGIVFVASLYATWGRKRRRARSRGGNAGSDGFDFGWAPAWTLAPWIGFLVAASAAVALQVVAPDWWPLSLALVLLAASFFAGARFTRSSTQRDDVVMPMVDLLKGEDDLILDAGCGAGRTTIAIGRIVRNGRIVALDRFDSGYIADGGRALLQRNLALAELADRVDIEQGDLTALPFTDQTFDSAVSAHAIDHLGPQKAQGLREILRVLKPGGRFLLVVWVPGWTMFTVANLLSFFLTPRRSWRRMASEAGFELLDEGNFNGVWFLLLGRPGEDIAKGLARGMRNKESQPVRWQSPRRSRMPLNLKKIAIGIGAVIGLATVAQAQPGPHSQHPAAGAQGQGAQATPPMNHGQMSADQMRQGHMDPAMMNDPAMRQQMMARMRECHQMMGRMIAHMEQMERMQPRRP